MASTQDEFADALQNAHMPAELPVYVETEIVGTDGAPHKVRRTLAADYAKRQDCRSSLQIDGDRQARKTWPRLASSSRSPRLPPRC